MQHKEAKELLKKYREGNCSAAEIAVLESWYLNFKDTTPSDLTSQLLDEARTKIWATLPVHEQPKKTVKIWTIIAAAASVVVCVTAGLLFYQQNKKKDVVKHDPELVKIVPGGNKAILTLADGSEISLTDAANGKIASQSGINITKAKDGQLVYNIVASAAGIDEPVVYNTITTPRGGEYTINLPDGTSVVLNAASSLRFPTTFVGSERKVELNGEGFFDVMHDKDKPFRVVSDHQTIEVLGTHFNINAYSDEATVKTTLVEGKVKVLLHKGASVVLKPGQQSVVNNGGVRVNEVNTEDVIAWTNNVFVFNKEKLGSIMRKISRWYDVDVVCPPELAEIEFSSSLSRNRSIKQVLKIMELAESFHFKIEGRRITVMP